MRTDHAELSAKITERYTVPLEWLNFIKNFSLCSNHAETKWFLTFEDFLPKENGFPWNEFELQSLTAAGSDHHWKNRIISYWNKHLPIMICVEGEYSYYAIDTENGHIVFGSEPEYEESIIIADNFELFMQKIITNEITL